MIPPEHQRIIDEIMAGGRIMPPKDERIRQRDAVLKQRAASQVASAPNLSPRVDGSDSDYYARKGTSGGFTGD